MVEHVGLREVLSKMHILKRNLYHVKSCTICWIFLRCACNKMENFTKVVINLSFFTANQTEDIWNISSRVNHEPIHSQHASWSPHDTRVSSQDFVVVPEYPMDENKPPPPPYSEGTPYTRLVWKLHFLYSLAHSKCGLEVQKVETRTRYFCATLTIRTFSWFTVVRASYRMCFAQTGHNSHPSDSLSSRSSSCSRIVEIDVVSKHQVHVEHIVSQ